MAVPPGGCNTPQKCKKRGPNVQGGGLGMLELQNLLKMKHMRPELRNVLGNVVFRTPPPETGWHGHG